MSNISVGRRHPAKPDLKLSEQRSERLKRADPTSPPDTPTTSPPQARKQQPAPFSHIPRRLNHDSTIRPVGNGHQFSYQPFAGPEQLSPRSTSSSSSASSDEESEDEDDGEEEEDGQHEPMQVEPPQQRNLPLNLRQAGPRAAPVNVPSSSEDDADSEPEAESESEEDSEEEMPPRPWQRPVSDSEEEDADSSKEDDDEQDSSEDDYPQSDRRFSRRVTRTTVICNFVIEDIDPMDSDYDDLDVLHPAEIESARSRSRSSHRELPIRIVRDLRNLNCSKETSDEDFEESIDNEDEADPEEAFYEHQQEMRRRRRVSMSSSIGKRTHSEISDSDCEDTCSVDVNEAGSSARRSRKRVHRTSLLFQDPPPPRIDELEEPSSSEDEAVTKRSLARELPYFTMEIMELDGSDE